MFEDGIKEKELAPETDEYKRYSEIFSNRLHLLKSDEQFEVQVRGFAKVFGLNQDDYISPESSETTSLEQGAGVRPR